MIHDRRAPNRKPATWLQIVNPIWWASDAERNHNWTWCRWFKRNPFCNFTMTIIGIAYQERVCHYSRSPWTYEVSGWNYGYSVPTNFPRLPHPFFSYRGTIIECALGWKTSGGFTATIRRSNSPNATETP